MTGVSSINLSYTTDALKYVNGANVCNDTIINDITGAFTSIPVNGAFIGAFYAGGEMLKKTDKVATSIFTGKEAKTIFGNTKYVRAGLTGLKETTSNIFKVLKNENIGKIVTSGEGLTGALKNGEMVTLVKDLAKAGKSESEILAILQSKSSTEGIIGALKDAAGQVAKPSKIAQLWTKFTGTSAGKALVGSNFYKKGMEKATEFLTTTAAGKAVASGASKFSNMFKSTGAGAMMIFEGGLAIFTDVIPAFSQGGFGEGVKQTAKSGVKVAASAAGWAVGATAGKFVGGTVGKVVGGAIGSILGPAGTIAGATIGTWVGTVVGDFVGGAIGSAITGKVAEKIVGKDYTDKVQEEATEQQAYAIAQSASDMNQLNNYVYQLIQEDAADGKLSKDSKKMLKYLEEGAGNTTNLAYNYSVASDTGLSALAARVQAGDTSIYTVPDDILEASSYGINASNNASFANNYTNFGYTNPYANNAVMDYYS